MKTFLICSLATLLATTNAFSQGKPDDFIVSLETVGEAATAGKFAAATYSQKQNMLFSSIRPVTVKYKQSPWFLLVIDGPDEKQVVHFTQEQLETIRKIAEARDGKTHYLEVTNFFEVYNGKARPEFDQQFLVNINFAISRKHWYRNNAVFMVSSMSVNEQHVIRFQLPFANNARLCRHVKAVHNLKEEFYEATAADFLRLFNSEPPPENIHVSAK